MCIETDAERYVRNLAAIGDTGDDIALHRARDSCIGEGQPVAQISRHNPNLNCIPELLNNADVIGVSVPKVCFTGGIGDFGAQPPCIEPYPSSTKEMDTVTEPECKVIFWKVVESLPFVIDAAKRALLRKRKAEAERAGSAYRKRPIQRLDARCALFILPIISVDVI